MDTDRSQAIRVLIIEDVPEEAALVLHHLKRAGLHCIAQRVDTEERLRAALLEFSPTIILSDFSLPQFSGLAALSLAREVAPDVPFIFVSGTIGEERAIEALHRGAIDYVLKNNLARLARAVQRALDEAAARGEQLRQRAQIARLDRVLRMLSGVNALLVRVRERTEVMRETCRLAISVGGYATAIVASKKPGTQTLLPVAWSGVDERLTEKLRAAVFESGTRESSLISQVIKTGRVLVCNDTTDLDGTVIFNTLLVRAGLHSVVALPLLVDNTPVGALVVSARDPGAISEEELRMLREVAGNLSFALQYLQKDTELQFLSHFDPQTGLAKRSLFCERISGLLTPAAVERRGYAVSVMDIERLSLINDSFGRRTADLLLQHVADRFKRRFPKTEQVAHFGGGTFAVIWEMSEKADQDMRAVVHEHVAALFGEPFVIEERQIPVAVRSGFALYPQHGEEANTLVQNAEAALRDARASGERQLHYRAEKHSEMVSRLALEHKLRLALDRQQFELHYQPKVNVATCRIEGVEALLRWRDPQNGLLSPAAFLPVLESTGLIVDVGEWVIRQAANDCKQWLREGLPPVRIAVNISPAELRRPEFTSHFLSAVEGWSTAKAGLDIEITEGVLQEDGEAEVKKLRELREQGIQIAIDDFGTGYSSLNRLSSFPIDTLKIDQSFVSQMLTQSSGGILVKAIIALARAFRMTTVAEGVETQQELDFLKEVGCDQSQGYLHSRPVAHDELAPLLAAGKAPLMLPAELTPTAKTHSAADKS